MLDQDQKDEEKEEEPCEPLWLDEWREWLVEMLLLPPVIVEVELLLGI